MKNNSIIRCYKHTKFLASSRGFFHCRGKCLKQLRRHLRMYMDRNCLYSVQNSANGIVFPFLRKISLPSGGGYKRVWANCYRNPRPVGAFAGQCTKKKSHTSVYPSSPGYKQSALHWLSRRSSGRGSQCGIFMLDAWAGVWWVPLGHQSLNLSTHLRRHSHQALVWIVSRIGLFLWKQECHCLEIGLQVLGDLWLCEERYKAHRKIQDNLKFWVLLLLCESSTNSVYS